MYQDPPFVIHFPALSVPVAVYLSGLDAPAGIILRVLALALPVYEGPPCQAFAAFIVYDPLPVGIAVLEPSLDPDLSAEIKQRLYRQFCDALRPGGVLFVGSTEVLPHTAQFGYEPVGISFYRRKNEI